MLYKDGFKCHCSHCRCFCSVFQCCNSGVSQFWINKVTKSNLLLLYGGRKAPLSLSLAKLSCHRSVLIQVASARHQPPSPVPVALCCVSHTHLTPSSLSIAAQSYESREQPCASQPISVDVGKHCEMCPQQQSWVMIPCASCVTDGILSYIVLFSLQ